MFFRYYKLPSVSLNFTASAAIFFCVSADSSNSLYFSSKLSFVRRNVLKIKCVYKHIYFVVRHDVARLSGDYMTMHLSLCFGMVTFLRIKTFENLRENCKATRTMKFSQKSGCVLCACRKCGYFIVR